MHPLKRLLEHSKKHKKELRLGTLYSILNKLFDVAPEVLIGISIDVVANHKNSFLTRFGIFDFKDQLYTLGALTLLVWMCESLFEYLLLVKWRNLAQTIQHELRLEAFEKTQNLDLETFENQSTGNMTSILNDDVNQLERFLNSGASDLIQLATTVIAVGGVFLAFSPTLTLYAFLPIPLIILGAFYFHKRVEPLYQNVRLKVGDLATQIQNNLSGIITVKSFTAENYEVKKLAEQSRNYQDANEKAIKLSSAFIPVIRMAILSGFLVTLILGGFYTFEGKLTIGSYGVLVFLTQRLLWPFTRLAETVDLYERAMAASQRVLNLISVKPKLFSTPSPYSPSLHSVRGEIEFKNVSFSYSNQVPVLQNLSFTILPSQTIGFVGPTGSGKSTILKLLFRFYDPSSGSICMDQRTLPEWDLQKIRQTMGLVSQDVYLFPGSIRENLLYGKMNATEKELIKACELSECMEFIKKLPEGLETVIGERGQKLSGGQRQRLSLARAILKDPKILVLDEATSAVDNETEAAIQRSLKEVTKNRTTIIIAHRLSTLTHAHQIHVVHEGRIIQSGTHHDLKMNQGLYQELWNVQVGGTQT